MRQRLPPELEDALERACASWREEKGTLRLLEHDASLWTGGDEAEWLGWLAAPGEARARLEEWQEIAADGRSFAHVLVLGMGGSSLAPEVQRQVVGRAAGFPAIEVLDSIHPDAVAATESRLDLEQTLVVVASKSGSTLEPNLLLAHFEGRLAALLGAGEAARRILAITDPGSALEAAGHERGFRHIVLGEPTIGGRFSALSPFGLVAAALQGIGLARWLDGAMAMAMRCRSEDPARNPGVTLGLLMAAAAASGRDKLTLVAHPRLAPFGTWLEQLIAESTGKEGRGVLPIDGEIASAPEAYGDDRLFVALRSAGALADGDSERLGQLAAAGHPVVEFDLRDARDLAGEFYRWEFATAVAGARLGVHPFDQPDVESAKIEARRLVAEVERTGALPAESALASTAGWSLFAAAQQGRVLRAAAGPAPSAVALLGAHLRRLGAGDYFAQLAFVPATDAARAALGRIRERVRSTFRVATTVGFGPRYLHSTGQAHKGGPASGLFIVITDEPRQDLDLPGPGVTLGQAVGAQARGDEAALAARGRRVIRVHLDGPAEELLPRFEAAVDEALEAGPDE